MWGICTKLHGDCVEHGKRQSFIFFFCLRFTKAVSNYRFQCSLHCLTYLDVDDGDGELAQYENRTFKADARIFHKNAWKTNVKDKSIVTLSTLVKEFNAAFGNDDGRTRIKKEYLAAQQSYINGIEEDESVRVYPKASSQATMLPCIQSNFIRFSIVSKV